MIDVVKESEALQFSPGDLLVDRVTGSIGVLIETDDSSKRSPLLDEHYDYRLVYWKVYWISSMQGSIFSFNGPSSMEEYGLKMSVVIGIYEYHSIKEEKNLEKNIR